MPRPLYHWGNVPGRSCVGTKATPKFWKKENIFHIPETEPSFLDRPSRNLENVPTELPLSLLIYIILCYIVLCYIIYPFWLCTLGMCIKDVSGSEKYIVTPTILPNTNSIKKSHEFLC
jgi:hypothetical protein